jgi:DNA-binding CsgD family transcriptional regulator
MSDTSSDLVNQQAAPETAGRRFDMPSLSGSAEEQASLWNALSCTPGIGVSVVDIHGLLLFVNNTSLVLFAGRTDIDYQGKSIGDFHSPEFTRERLELLDRVVKTGKPAIMRHVYLAQRIQSTLWPIRDRKPPFNRIVVVSRHGSDSEPFGNSGIETFDSQYIELGELNVLTKREFEIFVMLGHGLNIPSISRVLFRSPKTLERHKTAIARKLSLKSQADIVRIVSLLGLSYDDTKRKRLLNEPLEKIPSPIT